jgi:hypothetical protein
MRTYRAGENVEDLCRACKIDRVHTVIAADASGRPLRVQCDYCGSQHNFRGGSDSDKSAELSSRAVRGGGADAPQPPPELRRTGVQPVTPAPNPASAAGEPMDRVPALAQHERVCPPITVDVAAADLEEVLRRVIRAESGVTVAVPAEKWRDGHLVLRPGKPGLQDKSWPIETFFHKVVMIRNRLRTLEQQVNALDVGEDVKVKLQAYITACYGSLTSFNVLFADEDDQFKGAGE